MDIITPPLKIQGRKTKLIPHILDNLPDDFKTRRYIEPFMGSGVVGFNMPKSDWAHKIMCDINPHIPNFYKYLSELIPPEIVRDYLAEQSVLLQEGGEAYYYEVRNRFNESKNPLDFLFLNRTCYNGMIRFNRKGEYNVPFGKDAHKLTPKLIQTIHEQVLAVKSAISFVDMFWVESFETLLPKVDDIDFVYLDPPYVGLNSGYYGAWGDEQETILFNMLKKKKAKWMLSTWVNKPGKKNPYFQEYWNRFNVVYIDHHYRVGPRPENRGKVVESLVMNYG